MSKNKMNQFKQMLAANKGKQIEPEEKLFITVQVKDVIANVELGKIKINPIEVKDIVSDVVSRYKYNVGETLRVSRFYDCMFDLLVEKNNQFKVI